MSGGRRSRRDAKARKRTLGKIVLSDPSNCYEIIFQIFAHYFSCGDGKSFHAAISITANFQDAESYRKLRDRSTAARKNID